MVCTHIENHSCNGKISCSIKATVMPSSFQVGQCRTHCSHITNQLLNYYTLGSWFICSQLFLGNYTVGHSVTYLYTLLVSALGESSTDSQIMLNSRLYRQLPNCRKMNLHPILLQIMSTRFSKRYVFHPSSTTVAYTSQNLYPNLTRQLLMALYMTLASSLPHLFHVSGCVSRCAVAVYP